jgi:hypothetical protein
MGMMRLEPIFRHQVEAVWPLITQWLGALDERFPPWWRLADPKAKCRSGHAQLWLIRDDAAIKGAVITQITTDAARVAEVALVVGEDMESWLHLIDDLEHWARREGCVAMIATAAREGWVRALKHQGWTSPGVLMERRL